VGVNKRPVSLNRRSETSRKAVIRLTEGLRLLKEIPWYLDDEAKISSLFKLQVHLYQITGMVPNLITTVDGQLYMNSYGKRYFLQDFIVGSEWRYDLNQSYSAGSKLITFHWHTKVVPNEISINKASIVEISRGVLNLLARKIKKERRNLSTIETEELMKIITDGNVILRNLNDEILDLGYGSEVVVVHGDYNPNNMTYGSNDEVKAIYDFDNVCWDDPIHDIAEGLIDFSMIQYMPSSSRFEAIDIMPHKDRFHAFYKGYFKNGSDPRLKALIPACICITCIEFIGLGLLRDDWSSDQALHYINHLHLIKKNVYQLLDTMDELEGVP
jgi:thiamine kinase-like enzyme